MSLGFIFLLILVVLVIVLNKNRKVSNCSNKNASLNYMEAVQLPSIGSNTMRQHLN